MQRARVKPACQPARYNAPKPMPSSRHCTHLERRAANVAQSQQAQRAQQHLAGDIRWSGRQGCCCILTSLCSPLLPLRHNRRIGAVGTSAVGGAAALSKAPVPALPCRIQREVQLGQQLLLPISMQRHRCHSVRNHLAAIL